MNDSLVTVVTGNTKKYTEIAEALQHHHIQTKRTNADIDEIKSQDALAVLIDKCLKAFDLVQQPVIVDDSGIYFSDYNQFPGTYTKFLFQGVGYEGIFKLVQHGDGAVFKCFVAYMDSSLSEPQVFSGEYPGTITSECERDPSNEMPYAPMFIPDGESKDMASMTPLERAKDHRHQALDAFAEWYNKRS